MKRSTTVILLTLLVTFFGALAMSQSAHAHGGDDHDEDLEASSAVRAAAAQRVSWQANLPPGKQARQTIRLLGSNDFQTLTQPFNAAIEGRVTRLN